MREIVNSLEESGASYAAQARAKRRLSQQGWTDLEILEVEPAPPLVWGGKRWHVTLRGSPPPGGVSEDGATVTRSEG